MNIKKILVSGGVVASALALAVAAPVQAAEVYFQGFETDTAGWEDASGDGWGTITRVASGTGGIDSAEGGYHAIVEEDGNSAPFSRFDQYRDVWPGSWTAEIDVYLDPNWTVGSGFDYSVAANGSDGLHERDFIFHVAKDTSEDALLVGVSHNSNQATKETIESDANFPSYLEVPTAGWYTLQHRFYEDGGGYLAADMSVFDASDNLLFTYTLGGDTGNPFDTPIADAGGNRYAWFTFATVDEGVAIDDHSLTLNDVVTGEITNPASDGDVVSGVVTLAATYDDGDDVNDDAVQWAVRAQSCEVGATNVAGNVGGFSDDYAWDGSSFTADLDTSELAPGDYCFIFNPTDDAGQNNVRETRLFEVESTIFLPTSKDDCKKDGYLALTDAEGNTFRNQGQCVSYFNHLQ